VLYLALDLALRPYGNLGVWIAMTASYLLRVGSLGIYLPALLRDIESGAAAKHLDEGPASKAE